MHIPLGPGGRTALSPQKGLPETLLSGPCLCPYASRVDAPRHPWWVFLPPPVFLSRLAHPSLLPAPGSSLPRFQDARLYAGPGCRRPSHVGRGGECGLAVGRWSRKTLPESGCPWALPEAPTGTPR